MIINQPGGIAAMMTREQHQEFLDRVRETGRKINPETARMRAEKGYALNVYDLYPFDRITTAQPTMSPSSPKANCGFVLN
jgi:hypothetical protein